MIVRRRGRGNSMGWQGRACQLWKVNGWCRSYSIQLIIKIGRTINDVCGTKNYLYYLIQAPKISLCSYHSIPHYHQRHILFSQASLFPLAFPLPPSLHLRSIFPHNILMTMLRRELGLTEKINEKPTDDLSSDPKGKNKFASLAPYIAEIQRRKRLRSTNKRSNKNLNESSSKSFRIKEKSLTSLHKELSGKPRDPPNLIIKKFQEQIAKERRTRSVQRSHQADISRTIQSKPPSQKPNNNFFNDLYARVKSKMEQRPSRKRQHETLDEQRTRSEQAGELNMYKISYTNMTGMPEARREPELDSKKRTEHPPPKKNNFRRNKYEVLQSSVGEQEVPRVNLEKEQFLSDGKIVLDKKESNLTINIEMDRLAERQMESFYQQVITKQIHRSIQRSTEKYFNSQSYRPTKSKNDIQVFLSTLINPSLNKVSKSTNERSDYRKDRLSDYLDYDFDFRNQQELPIDAAINEQTDEEESTMQLKKEISDFERQRKKVEVEFFNKPDPHLDWSEDQCKIDEI